VSWELGEPLSYAGDRGPLNIPLCRATIWPEDMTKEEALFFAAKLEREGSAKIGAVPCGMGHESWWLPDSGCPWCEAVV
jgi:hypothetical protein